MGEVLRELRQESGLTLRDVSARALVSLGYLSEVERGRKEPSSELLGSICAALELELHELLALVSQRLRPAPLQALARAA
jgi:transcriptional regulator with XRE-family HTH domain